MHRALRSTEIAGELPGLHGAVGKITVLACAQMEIQKRSCYSCDASVSAWSQVVNIAKCINLQG